MSSHNSNSLSLSIKNETRDKFNALLNSTKRKKSVSKSKEQLLYDDDFESATTASSGNLVEKNVAKIELKEPNKDYILQKFLDNSHSNDKNEEFITVEVETIDKKVKPPIPKPRKKLALLQSPTVSQGTFEVTSPKFAPKQESSSSGDNTYNVEEIGDVLIHENSQSRPKITIKTQSAHRKFLEKGETENLSDYSSKTKSESNGNVSVKEDEDQEIIEMQEVDKILTSKRKKKVLCKEEISKDETTIDSHQNSYTYEKIVEIIIHKTDRLLLNSLVVHPVVKIHIVDITTGKYFPKSDKTRPVVFFYENKDCDYISPVMTHTFNLQEKRVFYPSWEETILFNEDYRYINNEKQKIILFFEILDFVSFSMLHQVNQKNCVKGWHNIAFAFLKLSPKNDVFNVGKKLRLQLYHSYPNKKDDPHICSAWIWWKKRKLVKYPSTLHISITPVVSPTKVAETFRSKTPIEGESSSNTALLDELKKGIPNLPTEIFTKEEAKNCHEDKQIWSRNSHETCKIPNKRLVEFDCKNDGCFIMKFSHNGLYLASAQKRENLFCLVIYSLISLKENVKFPAHQGLIYDIKWSSDDIFLISASADNTVAIFNISVACFIQILPHPSFVYCCDINHERIIASGCYDGIIRIWQEGDEFHLMQELEGHRGYLTSLCFSKNVPLLLSADSKGAIIEWKEENGDWILKREILLLDLKETIINQIQLFPKEKRLLVHSRDCKIRIVDLRTGCILHWLAGAMNKRVQIICSISPCGSYVYSGSENGLVHVWNSKNGVEIGTYLPFSQDRFFFTIHCVECHPQDNIIAISHYGQNLPILLYYHDKNIDQTQVNFTIKSSEDYYMTRKKINRPPLKHEMIIKNNKHLIIGNEVNEVKLDFKGILQKMDNVISMQT